MCVSMCIHAHVDANAHGCQKRILDQPEQELQVVVSLDPNKNRCRC